MNKISVSLTNINRKTRNKDIDYETVGYFGKNMKFVQTGVSQMNKTVDRMYVTFPTKDGKSYGMLWHTHPYNAGWWPSYEDLKHGGYKIERPVNVLFTRFGTWIYKGFRSKPAIKQQRYMHTHWKDFHTFMMKVTTEKEFNGDRIKHGIKQFIHTLKQEGYHIEFEEHFNSSESNNDEYTRKLYSKISRTLSNKHI